jgi:hypothetical protein
MKLTNTLASIVCSLFIAAPVFASSISISFDSAVGTYTPTPGTIQNVKNEFASLGFIFEDGVDSSKGATLGKCGPGNGAVALFSAGNDFAGCGNTRPNLNILFVDPTNIANRAYTTSVSLFNFDGLVKMTAFDISGNVLGSTQLWNGLLSLSGIGQIAKINLLSLDNDPTTMDDLTFESVVAFPSANVPEPSALGLFALGLVMVMYRRRSAI